MPSTVRDLFQAAGVTPGGRVQWNARVPSPGPGIYIVAMTASLDSIADAQSEAPLRQQSLTNLLEIRPELRLDGTRPGPAELAERIKDFWLRDETVLYIGLAGTSLRNRVQQYYRTPLGARKPHAGGWFLKVLTGIEGLWVHFGECDDPTAAEDAALREFCARVSEATRKSLRDSEHPFPFANLEWPRGVRKRHGITGGKESRHHSSRSGDRSRNRLPPRQSGLGADQRVHDRSPGLDTGAISAFLQDQLRRRGRDEVTPVEAAQWLDEAGLLKDSDHRAGLPLRNLLRAKKILGQRQEANRRWFIDRVVE